MRIAILVTVMLANSAFASTTDTGFNEAMPSGLEVPSGAKLIVSIENLSDEAKKIGLSDELILAKIKTRLRKNKIEIGAEKDFSRNSGYLYIRCSCIGVAYDIDLEFNRPVTYSDGSKEYLTVAPTYTKGNFGMHGNNSQYITNRILDLIDIFSNDFLKANRQILERKDS